MTTPGVEFENTGAFSTGWIETPSGYDGGALTNQVLVGGSWWKALLELFAQTHSGWAFLNSETYTYENIINQTGVLNYNAETGTVEHGDLFPDYNSVTGEYGRKLTFNVRLYSGYPVKSNNFNIDIYFVPDFYYECSMQGDINEDGVLNVLDIVLLINCVLNQSCTETELLAVCTDMNGDGVQDILDIVSLINLTLSS